MFPSLPSEHFKNTLLNILSGISFTNEMATPPPEQIPPSSPQQNSCVNLTLVTKSANYCDPVEDTNTFELESIRSTLERIHHRNSSSTAPVGCDGVPIPIMDITQVSASDLRSFLKLFKADVSEMTEKEVSDELLEFIPTATVKQHPQSEAASVCMDCSFVSHCSWCNQECCEHYPLIYCSFPRTGFLSSALCSECIKYNQCEDAKEWVKASLNLLAQVNDEAIIASIGCALVAIALGFDSKKLLKDIAKQLHSKGINAVAFRVLNLALSISKAVEPKLHFLASSILHDLIKKERMKSVEKFTLALASKEAFDAAFKALDRTATLPDSEVRIKEIEFLISRLLEKRIQLNLEQERFSNILVDHAFHFDAFQVNDDYLKEIVKVIMPSEVLPFDLTQLIDILIAFKKQRGLNFSDLPMAYKEIIELYFLPSGKDCPPLVDLGPLLSNATTSFSLQYAIKAGTQLELDNFHAIYSFCPVYKHLLTPMPCDDSTKNNIFIPSDKELTPPFMANSSSALLNPGLKRVEEIMVQLFNANKWSNMDVAGAYIDLAPTCVFYAEKIICYLLAAMWMARNFTPTSKYPPDVLYAYKSIIMNFLLLCCETALYNCHNPGLELYVIRVAIGIIKKITQVPNCRLVFTEEDAFFLQKLLKRLSKVASMNSPFFHLPTLSLSEAAIVDRSTRKIHSAYMFELQSIKPEHRKLQDIDLNYQLYQNDVFSTFPLKNSSDIRARAMDELLKSEGLSWNDVSQAMSTPLCLRDKEGWLIQTPELGVPLQYSKLVGFVFDADEDEPSLKLLVVEADPKTGKKGLFSQEDVSAMLQLDLDDGALFFSLDQPSNDLEKSRHPFQQWRHHKKITGTEVLNTMFITDYLMKSFVTDTDISSKPPFKQRPCKDGLIKNLSSGLQKAIRPIKERYQNSQPKSHRNRFWIESKEVKYTKSQKGLRYEYHFGEVDMAVKSESSPYGIDLTLSLTEQNSPDSPHISFATDMTKHYIELSEYFPVFARLRELSKLQFFSFELQSLVEMVKAQLPDKAASLTCFIQSFKQQQSHPFSSNTCTWVPAVTSPKLQSIHYGGVQLKCLKDPIRYPCINSSIPDTYFMSGCSGSELLESKFVSPHEIINPDSLQILGDFIKPASCDVRNCHDTLHGMYLIQKPKEVVVGMSCDVFKTVSATLKDDPEMANFSVVEMRTDVDENALNLSLNAFIKQVNGDFCSNTKSVAQDLVQGVRFSREGIECKTEEIVHVAVQIKPQFFAQQENVSDYTYSPPNEEAEIQIHTSQTRFDSWNKTDNESSLLDDSERSVVPRSSQNTSTIQIQIPGEKEAIEIDTAEILHHLHLFLEELSSANERVTLSTFRRNNSTELNKHLDRLYHSVYMGLLPIAE